MWRKICAHEISELGIELTFHYFMMCVHVVDLLTLTTSCLSKHVVFISKYHIELRICPFLSIFTVCQRF